MFESIESYLAALKSALKDADPALVQDALWDAEAHLNSGLAAQREQHPEVPEAEALAGLQATFGTPEEVAEAYLEREAVVAQALDPKDWQNCVEFGRAGVRNSKKDLAATWFERTVAARPKEERMWNEIALAYADGGVPARAFF